MMCPCHCGGEVKPGNKFAAKGCSLRAIPKAERSARALKWHAAGRPKPAPPAGPVPTCQYCERKPVRWRKGRWNAYCSRYCAGAAVQEWQTREYQKQNGERLRRAQRERYAARMCMEVEAICDGFAKGRTTFTVAELAPLVSALMREAKSYGYRAADMKWRRALEARGLLNQIVRKRRGVEATVAWRQPA